MVISDKDLLPEVLGHYERVGAYLERSFGGTPIVYANFPAGLDAGPHFRETDVPLTATKLLWLCHRDFAIEFHGWAPYPQDRNRLQFARILLEPSKVDFDRVKEAALAVRSLLAQLGLESVPILDGLGGMALWIPLADAPQAEVVREWLHRFCQQIVASHGSLVSTEPNTHVDGRVHLHVSSNAAGRWSVLPYSIRWRGKLSIATPFTWGEIGDIRADAATPENFAQRIEHDDDVFAEATAAITGQRFADANAPDA